MWPPPASLPCQQVTTILLAWINYISSSFLVTLLLFSARLSILSTGAGVVTLNHTSSHAFPTSQTLQRLHILRPRPWLSLGPHFLPLFPLLSSSYWSWGSLTNKQACTWGLLPWWPRPGSPFSLIPTWIFPWLNQVSQIKHLFTESSLTAQLQKQPHHHALLLCPGHHTEGGGWVCVHVCVQPSSDVHSRSREGDSAVLSTAVSSVPTRTLGV